MSKGQFSLCFMVKFEIDFRHIYATVLNKWLEVDDEVILEDSFDKLKFI